MSSTLPPDGPTGPGTPEYLQQGSDPQGPGRRPAGRTALVAGGAVAGLLVVAGGIWAATSFFSSGPQPAEALPAGTIGYASIDLDPSGSQKIEAVKMLRKFPAFTDHVDLGIKDDIRRAIFDEIQKESPCEGLDYDDDIEPWIGDRAAVAAVDLGEDQPSPVFVLQVSDADAADAALKKIQACTTDSSSGDTEGAGGWSIDGDWAVVAETEDLAQQVADEAAKASLADDEDYQHWMDEVGDAGIINLYAAPAAGSYLADNLGGFGPMGGTAPSEATGALKNFKGMAATLRFDGGALEFEVAGDPGVDQGQFLGGDQGDDAIASLPEDTAAAIGASFGKGWFSGIADQLAAYSGSDMSAQEFLDDMSQQSGLDLPDDVETLVGDSIAVSIGSDFDPETFFNSTNGDGVPVAAKVKGDPAAIEDVLAKLQGQMGTEEGAFVGSDSDGDWIAIGPDADYRTQVLDGGSLGDSAVFKDVVPDAGKASLIIFVNFDAGDGWLVKAVGDDQETADNLEPLGGLGMSAWRDGDTSHAVLRLTTD